MYIIACQLNKYKSGAGVAMLGRSGRPASKKERTQHERSCFQSPSLSPNRGRQGHSGPPSPILTPPSPTHSPSTTDFRGRNPDDGICSLQVVQQHDHATLGVPASAATTFTAGPSIVKAPIGKAGKGDGSDPPSTVAHINPLDDNTDPTPFAFNPYALAALVHPKTLKDLDTMGGLDGLCAGLGTNPTKGLSAHSLDQGAGDGKIPGEGAFGAFGAFGAPLSDRQRVYGTNSLPTRPSKSLALKDKVLVCEYQSPNPLHLALLIVP